MCRRCEVIDTCLKWALESGQDAGVWGGMSEDERRENAECLTRTITRAEVHDEGDVLRLVFEGDGFMYKMVRMMVGSLIHVARGREPLSWLHDLIDNPAGEKTKDGCGGKDGCKAADKGKDTCKSADGKDTCTPRTVARARTAAAARRRSRRRRSNFFLKFSEAGSHPASFFSCCSRGRRPRWLALIVSDRSQRPRLH